LDLVGFSSCSSFLAAALVSVSVFFLAAGAALDLGFTGSFSFSSFLTAVVAAAAALVLVFAGSLTAGVVEVLPERRVVAASVPALGGIFLLFP
jgi:hypothetical protein